MSQYQMMLANGIDDELAVLDPARQAEIKEWARRLRSIIDAAGPNGWLALALVTADWTRENNAQGKHGE